MINLSFMHILTLPAFCCFALAAPSLLSPAPILLLVSFCGWMPVFLRCQGRMLQKAFSSFLFLWCTGTCSFSGHFCNAAIYLKAVNKIITSAQFIQGSGQNLQMKPLDSSPFPPFLSGCITSITWCSSDLVVLLWQTPWSQSTQEVCLSHIQHKQILVEVRTEKTPSSQHHFANMVLFTARKWET